jgi:probable HAF family extracellular repeat protein
MSNKTNRRSGVFRTAIIGISVGGLTLAGCLVAPAFTVAAPAPANAVWRMVDLGAGDDSVAWAINDRGHVVGTRASGEAFLWRNGRITDLGTFAPTDINNRDEVVGFRWDDNGTHAVHWRDGVRTDLASTGGTSYATAVNDRGEVVGWTAEPDRPTRASSWEDGDLTLVGEEGTTATDVNNRGQIVGSASTFDQVAVRWWRGTQTTLRTEPSQAVAVNRQGTVAGLHFSPQGTAGFVWQRGRIVELPPPPGEPLFSFTQPEDINGRTQVVGTSSDGAFVWERGRTTLLPGRTRAAAAYDINERGVIAGANPTTPDGLAPHAVIWRR